MKQDEKIDTPNKRALRQRVQTSRDDFIKKEIIAYKEYLTDNDEAEVQFNDGDISWNDYCLKCEHAVRIIFQRTYQSRKRICVKSE